MLDKLGRWDMKGRRDKDMMDKLELMECLGFADNLVSMVLMDFAADIPVDCQHRHQSIQLHHLDFHRL